LTARSTGPFIAALEYGSGKTATLVGKPSPVFFAAAAHELLRREEGVLHVRGLDMLDGTPVLDLKPYLSSIPAEDLRRGWLAAAEERATRR
jgi:tRNA (adenine37-N6)-methyltransferase